MVPVAPLPAPDALCAPGMAQQRSDVRNHMFVTAALQSEHGAAPVRIRNMSRGGALIEAAAIPPDGSAVRLVRASLSVRGQIAWRRDGRAGVKFDTAIDPADWLPSGNRASHQQRVDEMMHICRTSPVPADAETPPAGGSQAEAIRQLLDLRDTLNLVAEELAGNTAVAMAHATALQKIDVGSQLLDKLAERLAGRR